MVNGKGLHHLSLRKRIHEKGEVYPSRDKFKRFVDKMMYFVGFLAVLFNFVQVIKIYYEKSAMGVSIISWGGFAFVSISWLIYGFLHKEKQIIFMYIGLLIIQILIVLGVFIYG